MRVRKLACRYSMFKINVDKQTRVQWTCAVWSHYCSQPILRLTGGVMVHQQQGEKAGLNSAWWKASTEGFRCVASDNLFQSDTVLGKNENLKESMRHGILMKEWTEVDLVALVEWLKWSIVRAAKPCTALYIMMRRKIRWRSDKLWKEMGNGSSELVVTFYKTSGSTLNVFQPWGILECVRVPSCSCVLQMRSNQWHLVQQLVTPGSKLLDVYNTLPKTNVHNCICIHSSADTSR